MKSLETTFDYAAFVDEGFAAQSKYAKKAGDKWTPEELLRIDALRKVGGEETSEFFNEALQARYAKIIEHMGHLVEEMVDARVYVPRRSWKNNEPSFLDNDELRGEFVAEVFDMLLFHRAICAYAGITGTDPDGNKKSVANPTVTPVPTEDGLIKTRECDSPTEPPVQSIVEIPAARVIV